MKRKIWKRLIAVGCAVSMLMTAPGVMVFAEEIQTSDEEIASSSDRIEVGKDESLSVDQYYDTSVDEKIVEDADDIIASKNNNEDSSEKETVNELIEVDNSDDSYVNEIDEDILMTSEPEAQESLVSASSNLYICGVDIGIAPGSYMQFQTYSSEVGYTNSNSGYYYNRYYLASSQCFGFARWCQYKLFGYHSASSGNDFYKVSANGVSSIARGSLTTSNLKSMIQASKIGAHLRTNANSSGTAHSMVITGISDTGFSIAQCNGSNNNEYSSWKQNYVGTYTYTWNSYVNSTYGERGIAYIELPKNYPYDYAPINNVESGWIDVSPGTKDKTTQIWWDAGNNAAEYDVKIWKGKLWEGDPYKVLWGLTDLWCEVDLTDGYYECYVDYRNGDAVKMSQNTKGFTVTGRPEAVSGWVDVSPGTADKKTIVWWDPGENIKYYDVKIWKGKLWEGDPYKIIWSLTDTWCEVDLPNGDYEFYVDYRNDYSLNMSRNTKGFTVTGRPEVVSGWVGVGEGTNYTPTSIWWDAGEHAIKYDLKIWKGKLWEGDAYKILWDLSESSCSVSLPSGYYEAYVDYKNDYSINMSRNTISFTIGEGVPVDIGDNVYAAVFVNTNWKPLVENGSNVVLGEDSLEDKSRYWKFEKQSDGSYVIRNIKDDKVLEAAGSKDENGINVQVNTYNGGNNQKWFIYGRWSGEYYLRPKSASRVLDVNGGANNAGDNLNLWELNYSTAQQFAIYKANAPGSATLKCTPGTSSTPTEFKWNATSDTDTYSVKIYKGEHWIGENVKNVWDLTETTCKVDLPAGDYEAYVDSCNSVAVTMSNVVQFTVGKASISAATVTGISNKTYTGSAQTQNPTVKLGSKTLTNGTDYTLSYLNNVNAGTATVTITGKNDYTGSISKTFTISALSIANATVTGIANKTYSGSAQTQNPTVKVGDKTLTSGTDYTVGYSNNVNAGTATVTMNGKGNYTGSVSKTFTISALSGSGATVTGISNKTYNGSAHTQNPTVKDNDRTLVSGTDYTLSYSNNTNAGTAKVTITFKGNYTGSVSKNFTINQASPTLNFASTSVTKTTLDAAFTNVLTKKTDGTVTFKSSNTNVAIVDSDGKVTIKGEGAATITASAAAGTNYKAGSASYDLTVVDGRQNISGYAVTLSPASYTYNGSACKPTITVKNGSFTLTSGTDYTVSYSNNTNVGTGKVTITGKGNYTGTINKTFAINQASPTLTFASAGVTKTTLDEAFTNTLTKKTDGTVTFKSGDTGVATVDSASGLVTIKGEGTTTITATATAGTNYKAGSASYTLTVVDGRIDISTCTVTLSTTTYTYNGSAKKPTVTVKNGSTVLISGTDYTVAYKNNTNAGTATVTITGKGNYKGTASKTFTINKAAASLKFASASIEKTTLDAAFTNELTKTTDGTVTFKSSDTGVATVDSASGLVTIKGEGTTTITAAATAGTNYKAGSASYTLMVVDGRIDISTCTVTLSSTSYTYNGSAKKPTVTVKNGSTTLTSGTDYTVAYKNNTNAGTATVTITGKGIYKGTVSKTFTINKAAASLKFASASVEKTTLDATFTNELTKTTDGTVTFKSGDTGVATVDSTSGLVTIKGEGTTTITATATAGTNYKAGSASYTLTVVDGRIDISTCTVTLSATSYTYNGSAKKPTVTVKNGSTTLTSGTDYTVSYKNNTNAGTATVTVTGKGNYTGSVSKKFTIKKATPSLKFAENAVSKSTLDEAFTNELTKTTDGTVTFTSNDTGIASVDSESGLVTIKGAGTAVITATAVAGKNYNAGNASYALAVTPVSIEKASVAGVSLSYGYSGKAYTPTMTVKVNGVTLTEGTDYTVKIENNKNPGTATITLTGKGKYTGTRIKTFEIVDCVSSLVSGKTYQLIPKNNSSTAVCAYSGKMLKNTKVYITDRSASEAMRFKAIQNSDGTWKFINAKCEMALAVQQNSSALGAGIVLYDQTTKKAQNWNLSKKSDNSWAIMNAVTGYSIAMSDESAVKGTTLSMAETQSNGLQRFYIAETDPVDASFDGTYFIRAGKDKNFVVNIAGASKEDGANVNLNSYSNTNSKKFKAIYSGAGYYRLVNVNSGMVLSVEGNTKKDGTNVIQSTWVAQSGQRWKFTKNSDGTVTLTNALGTNLHLTSNKTASGTNIVAKNASTSTAQKWYLQ